MPEKRGDPEVSALQAVYGALKSLDDDTRRRVLSSALALLGMEAPGAALGTEPELGRRERTPRVQPSPAITVSRPVALIELVQEKQPTTSAQRIAVFAYYREKHEGQPRFSRDDLSAYFAKAKLPPSGNYDRDFVEAVRKGWIHEDGADSYLTSKGVEAVEGSFPGERKYTKPTGAAARQRPRRGKPKPRRGRRA